MRAVERRLIMAFVLFVLVALMLSVRVTWLQAVEADSLQEKATNQRLRTVELPATRGRILDRNGEELATSVPAKAVYATPYQIEDKQAAAERLAALLDLEIADVEEKLSRDTGFVYIARQVRYDIGMDVEAADIAGVGLLEESKRIYPEEGLAAQTVGFTDIDGNGLEGVENQYDSILGGEKGELVAELDPRGRTIPAGVQVRKSPVPGQDIQLTIDRDIQYHTEKAMGDALEATKAKAISAVVLDVRTGAILAMATAPSFNPNVTSTRVPEAMRNRSLTDRFEPGSTFKPVIIASALDSGVIDKNFEKRLPYKIKVADRWIHESHGRSEQNFSVSRIVSESSNVGAVTIGLLMGKDLIYDSIKEWGLIDRTGIDFPGEVSGSMPAPENWSGSTIGNIPIGQGVAVTPLAMVRAFAAVGNDGVLVTPHLTRSIAGDIIDVAPPKSVLDQTTANDMLEMLRTVVTEGTGSNAAIDGYTVAGKTGTAQKFKDGSYNTGAFYGSFVGLVPASDPQIAIIVVVDEPVGAYYGGTVAAPVFKEIGEYSVIKLRIPPDAGQGD